MAIPQETKKHFFGFQKHFSLTEEIHPRLLLECESKFILSIRQTSRILRSIYPLLNMKCDIFILNKPLLRKRARARARVCVLLIAKLDSKQYGVYKAVHGLVLCS